MRGSGQGVKSVLAYGVLPWLFVASGVFMARDSDGTRRHSPEFVQAVGWFGIVFFGLGAIVGLRLIVRPSSDKLA